MVLGKSVGTWGNLGGKLVTNYQTVTKNAIFEVGYFPNQITTIISSLLKMTNRAGIHEAVLDWNHEFRYYSGTNFTINTFMMWSLFE